jgi:multisubunit Na+/H+ antiporter MnhG subunit
VDKRALAVVYGGLVFFVVLFALGIVSSKWTHPLEKALAYVVLVAVLITSPVFALYLAKRVADRA